MKKNTEVPNSSAQPKASASSQMLKQELNQRRRQKIAFVLSVSLHILIAVIFILNPHLGDWGKPIRHTEVELIDPQALLNMIDAQKKQDLLNGQIVEQDKHAINDEKPVDSKFLSQHNQTVVKQTQAATHGQFKNTDGSAGEVTQERKAGKVVQEIGLEAKRDQPAKAKSEPSPKAKKLVTATDGITQHIKPTMKDLMPSFKPGPPPTDAPDVAQGGGSGPSATDDHLKDVATGMQTLLSTREFVYYSYYNRIKEKLRQYWEPKIKEKMEHILRTGRTIASNTDRITRVVIVLDNSGTLVRVQIIGPSGVNDLDDAAVEAFRAAAPFPNPPKGIADPDGTIKIRWDFILEANNSKSLVNAIRFAQNADGH